MFRAAGAHSVWVFGSVAHGDAGPGSDLDLAVILPEQPDATRLDQATALLVALHSALSVDLLIFRPDEWVEAQEHPMFRGALQVQP
jgi:predicted nucleotidyltransferase